MIDTKKRQVFILFIFIFLAFLLVFQIAESFKKEGVLKVAFLDVGQGDSIFIESPSGTQVLIDGGRDRSVLRQLSKQMPFFDRSIDMLIATHPDIDHIGGLISVLKRFRVTKILRPGVASDTPATESLLKNIAGDKTEEIFARRGQVYDLGGGAVLQILFPDRDVFGLETNMASIVAKLSYGSNSFLFTGDSPIAIEEYLVSLDGFNLKSDVLKLGHHGSKTSSSDLFMGFVAPKYAIISAGKDNKYGHPHKEVIDKLERFEIPYLNTAKSGTIIFESDGENLKIKTRR